jgi:hypothetical protein
MSAVCDGIGLAEALLDRRAERHLRDEVAGERAAHLLGRRLPCLGQHPVLQPDLRQGAEDIGTQLDSRPDFAEFAGLFQDPDGKAFERQGMGGHQPANAAAGDQERQGSLVSTRHAFSSHPVVAAPARSGRRWLQVLAFDAGCRQGQGAGGHRRFPQIGIRCRDRVDADLGRAARQAPRGCALGARERERCR